MARKRKKKSGKENPFSAYQDRNAILKTLGFDSYDAYQESDLWKQIRERVLDKPVCVGCGGHAFQVHHEKYTVPNLSGARLEFLVPICRECHNSIEFDGDRKCGMREVANRLATLRGLPPAFSPPKPKKHRKTSRKQKRAVDIAPKHQRKSTFKCDLTRRHAADEWIVYESMHFVSSNARIRIREIGSRRVDRWQEHVTTEIIPFRRAVEDYGAGVVIVIDDKYFAEVGNSQLLSGNGTRRRA